MFEIYWVSIASLHRPNTLVLISVNFCWDLLQFLWHMRKNERQRCFFLQTGRGRQSNRNRKTCDLPSPWLPDSFIRESTKPEVFDQQSLKISTPGDVFLIKRSDILMSFLWRDGKDSCFRQNGISIAVNRNAHAYLFIYLYLIYAVLFVYHLS